MYAWKFILTKINSLICIFKDYETFYDLYLQEGTVNGCIRDFYTIHLLSLINGEAVSLYHNIPPC